MPIQTRCDLKIAAEDTMLVQMPTECNNPLAIVDVRHSMLGCILRLLGRLPILSL